MGLSWSPLQPEPGHKPAQRRLSQGPPPPDFPRGSGSRRKSRGEMQGPTVCVGQRAGAEGGERFHKGQRRATSQENHALVPLMVAREVV